MNAALRLVIRALAAVAAALGIGVTSLPAGAMVESPSAKVPEAHIPLGDFPFLPEVFGP